VFQIHLSEIQIGVFEAKKVKNVKILNCMCSYDLVTAINGTFVLWIRQLSKGKKIVKDKNNRLPITDCVNETLTAIYIWF
jgi:hypothetical protein